MDKVQEILLNNNIDISNTHFSCLDGTNAMSGEHTGLQRRIHNLAPFSVYVNCRCHQVALCFKHLFGQFAWLESIDTLLLGLCKAFYYSGKNCNILRSLQEAYGIKALNLVKAVVTRWLSHGAACKRCRERYHIITEALDDIISTINNLELVTYRNTLLTHVYQIMSLEYVLSVTNILSLLLQLDKKNFSAIAHLVNTVIEILKNIGENIDTNHWKNFNNANEIIEKIEVSETKYCVFGYMQTPKARP